MRISSSSNASTSSTTDPSFSLIHQTRLDRKSSCSSLASVRFVYALTSNSIASSMVRVNALYAVCFILIVCNGRFVIVDYWNSKILVDNFVEVVDHALSCDVDRHSKHRVCRPGRCEFRPGLRRGIVGNGRVLTTTSQIDLGW